MKAKEASGIAYKVAIGQKKKEQMLKKAQQEADKAEKAIQRAIAMPYHTMPCHAKTGTGTGGSDSMNMTMTMKTNMHTPTRKSEHH